MDEDGQQIIDRLGDISRKARTGDYPGAALSLNTCILKLQEFLEPARSKVHDPRIAYSLQTLLLMIERKDWVAAADVIDYEFIPLWEKAFPS